MQRLGFTQAFKLRGYPKDDKVFAKSSPLIVRHDDLLDGELLGSELPYDSCRTSLRNVCKAELDAELMVAQEALHVGLARISDHATKAVANMADLLVMFIAGVGDGPRQYRLWLLVKGIYSPKAQGW